MKKMIYINEENFKVEVLVKEVKDGEVEWIFIENGEKENLDEGYEWRNGWMINGELYYSKEEYYYDNKKPIVKF